MPASTRSARTRFALALFLTLAGCGSTEVSPPAASRTPACAESLAADALPPLGLTQPAPVWQGRPTQAFTQWVQAVHELGLVLVASQEAVASRSLDSTVLSVYNLRGAWVTSYLLQGITLNYEAQLEYMPRSNRLVLVTRHDVPGTLEATVLDLGTRRFGRLVLPAVTAAAADPERNLLYMLDQGKDIWGVDVSSGKASFGWRLCSAGNTTAIAVGARGTVGFVQSQVYAQDNRVVILSPPQYQPQQQALGPDFAGRQTVLSAVDEQRQRLFVHAEDVVNNGLAEEPTGGLEALGPQASQTSLGDGGWNPFLPPMHGSQVEGFVEGAPTLYVADDGAFMVPSFLDVYDAGTLQRLNCTDELWSLRRDQDGTLLTVVYDSRAAHLKSILQRRAPITLEVLRSVEVGENLTDLWTADLVGRKAYFPDQGRLRVVDLDKFAVEP